MTDYPKPPFETTRTWIEDTFDPEKPPIVTVVDLNDLSNEELLERAPTDDLALKIFLFRLDQQDQQDQKD
jgi:hypothetical protein